MNTPTQTNFLQMVHNLLYSAQTQEGTIPGRQALVQARVLVSQQAATTPPSLPLPVLLAAVGKVARRSGAKNVFVPGYGHITMEDLQKEITGFTQVHEQLEGAIVGTVLPNQFRDMGDVESGETAALNTLSAIATLAEMMRKGRFTPRIRESMKELGANKDFRWLVDMV